MTFAAAIFDLDGTLVDTERLTVEAGLRAFADMGIAVEAGFLRGMAGKDDATCARIVAGTFPAMDFAAFARRHDLRLREAYAAGIPLKPHARTVLDGIRLPKAVATSSTRPSAERKLAAAGLAAAFRHVVTVDDVTRPKPAPDPFLLAAELLGVDPRACVAFEDSETGARAARAAGMTVVQVPDMQPTDGAHAHHVAGDLLAGARAVGLIAG
jgi:HAD superfamily hydrolase (TIGR01509 family)